MNYRPSAELEQLLNALADETLTEAEGSRLAAILRADAEARRYYRQWQSLHAALMWDYAAAAVSTPANVEPIRPAALPSSSRRWREITTLAAAVLLAAALAVFWLRRETHSAKVVVQSMQGAVMWSDGRGTAPVRLTEGAKVSSGTIVAEGGAAHVALRFVDGTVVSLHGDAELAFFDRGQKRLELRRGSMSAEVEHQPKGRPMLISTPTAEVEVVGTMFDLSTESSETALNVDKGLVKLRRLIDGKVVEVGTQQGVVASLAPTDLAPSALQNPPAYWRRSFETPPPPTSEGRWIPAGDGLPSRERAVPFVAARKDDRSPIIHYGVGVRAAVAAPRAYAAVGADSVLRFRYRVARETGLKCFLSSHQPGGGFGGNFELTWPVPHTAPEAGGWRTAELPFVAATALMEDTHPTLVGSNLNFVLIHSYESDAGLEISDIEVAPSADWHE